MITQQHVKDTWDYILRDHASWPVRFWLEVLAWIMSIGCSVVMAMTVPNPPLVPLYAVWIVGCAIYTWAAWTRGSFGMLANYLLLTLIDSVGLIRMLFS